MKRRCCSRLMKQVSVPRSTHNTTATTTTSNSKSKVNKADANNTSQGLVHTHVSTYVWAVHWQIRTYTLMGRFDYFMRTNILRAGKATSFQNIFQRSLSLLFVKVENCCKNKNSRISKPAMAVFNKNCPLMKSSVVFMTSVVPATFTRSLETLFKLFP